MVGKLASNNVGYSEGDKIGIEVEICIEWLVVNQHVSKRCVVGRVLGLRFDLVLALRLDLVLV